MEGALGRVLNGVRARGATSVIILIVAVVAVAAAATGPAFATAAEAAILADTVHDAPVVSQGVELTWQSDMAELDRLTAVAQQARAESGAPDLFPTLVRGQEQSFAPAAGQQSVLAWRDGACDHLRIAPGRCASAAGEVMVSRATARLDGLAVGSVLHFGAVPLRVAGIYEPLDPAERYWSARGYFPQGGAQPAGKGDVELVDVILTVPGTMTVGNADATGVTAVYLPLALDAVTPARVAPLRAAMTRMGATVAPGGGSLVTAIGDALDRAATSARVLRVPVVLITVQLLVPVWLLLFLAIGDAAEARAPDVALSALRGHTRLRTLAFGLAEPLALLAAAFPVGVLAGWGATALLARGALRPGTPVELPALAVVAAAGALSAGVLAAGFAGWRAVRRPVLEQWRRTSRGRTRRGGVIDVAVLVATAAGIVELYASGAVGSASTHVLALLVPGLVGLGVAVLTSRVLPWACRRAFGPSGRRGSLAPFLAVRQVARRPAGLRTVLLLTTSFALATFAVAAWTVAATNTAAVAATRTGAATVLDVVPSPAEDLATTVDRLDPGGTQAMAVDVFGDESNGARQTIAVDTARFAHVGYWRADFGPAPAGQLAARLHPPASEPVAVPGDRIRVRVTGASGTNPVALRAEVKLPGGHAQTPLELGTLPASGDGSTTLEATVSGGPAVLRGLLVTVLDPSGGYHPIDVAHGTLTIAALESRVGGAWRPLPAAALTTGGPWRGTGTTTDAAAGTVSPGSSGLRLDWRTFGGQVGPQVTWTADGFPDPLPALVTPDVAALPRNPERTVTGLDGAALAVTPAAVVTVPGAPSGGLIVDRTYALRAAYDTFYSATHQVWLADGAPTDFARRLSDAGVRVVQTRTAAGEERVLRRQGPALASVLFVADSGVAALLATVGAAAGLHLAGRRRRYELSALAAAGCRRGELRAALWLEQLAVLGGGLVAGALAGVLAAFLALPAVPEFIDPPAQPTLLYTPQWALVGALLGAVGLVTAAVVLLSGASLVAAARPDQLREASA